MIDCNSREKETWHVETVKSQLPVSLLRKKQDGSQIDQYDVAEVVELNPVRFRFFKDIKPGIKQRVDIWYQSASLFADIRQNQIKNWFDDWDLVARFENQKLDIIPVLTKGMTLSGEFITLGTFGSGSQPSRISLDVIVTRTEKEVIVKNLQLQLDDQIFQDVTFTIDNETPQTIVASIIGKYFLRISNDGVETVCATGTLGVEIGSKTKSLKQTIGQFIFRQKKFISNNL